MTKHKMQFTQDQYVALVAAALQGLLTQPNMAGEPAARIAFKAVDLADEAAGELARRSAEDDLEADVQF